MPAPGSDPLATAAAAAPEDIAALFFDVNGDGDQDLYITSGGVECAKADASLADRLYLNNGRGVFSLAPEGTLPDLRDSSGSVVVFENPNNEFNHQYQGAVLKNFTITNGSGWADGSGIRLHYFSSPTLSDLIISNNTSYQAAGGIDCESTCHPNIENVIVSNNTSAGAGLTLLKSIGRIAIVTTQRATA